MINIERNSANEIALTLTERGTATYYLFKFQSDNTEAVKYCIATDSSLQNLPWVRYTNKKTGEVHVYENEDNRITEDEIAQLEKRVMDCMDCHNRPSHDYRSPFKFINDAITAGKIPKELPELQI